MIPLVIILVIEATGAADKVLARSPPFGNSALAKLSAAEVVVIGRVLEIDPIRGSIRGLAPLHVPKGAKMFACQLQIATQQVIKGQVPRNFSVTWLSWRECHRAEWQELGLRKSASCLFYLTRQSGRWRPIADGPGTSFNKLEDHGDRVARIVRAGADPRFSLAVVLVYLEANIHRVRFSEDWSHGGATVGELVGIDRIPEVLDRVFPYADQEGRQSICFLASDLGMCTACVADYLYRQRDRDLWEPVIRYRESLLEDELRPGTLRGLEKSMKKAGTEVRSYLRFYSCHSNIRIRSRARSLLQRVFREYGPPLCLPCDGHRGE